MYAFHILTRHKDTLTAGTCIFYNQGASICVLKLNIRYLESLSSRNLTQ